MRISWHMWRPAGLTENKEKKQGRKDEAAAACDREGIAPLEQACCSSLCFTGAAKAESGCKYRLKNG